MTALQVGQEKLAKDTAQQRTTADDLASMVQGGMSLQANRLNAAYDQHNKQMLQQEAADVRRDGQRKKRKAVASD